MLNKLLGVIYNRLLKASNILKEKEYRKKFDIHPTAKLNHIENIWLKGNIKIGANTYINSGRFVTGNKSFISIGEWSALGHNINVIAWTHDIDKSTGPINERPTHEADIKIGNNCWIGSNVFIREGITIKDNVIIAANSVVTMDIPDNAIAGGVPAKLIKFKNEV